MISFRIFFSSQEISRAYFHTCLRDYAGVDSQKDNLDVHFVVIAGNKCNRDDFMVILFILLLLSLTKKIMS